MISERALGRAVELGILTADQVGQLRELERGAGAPDAADDERVRFVTGFGDVFVTIGIVLFLGAFGYFGSGSGFIGTCAVIAVASWLLAEFFTRRRRMALPSIVLLLAFGASIFGLLQVGAQTWLAAPVDNPAVLLSRHVGERETFIAIGASLATVAALALHYLRFRVPITIAAGAAAALLCAVGLLYLAFPGFVLGHPSVILLACGIVAFALAMRFDVSDLKRQTRRTDIAFWLHFLAAPLLVHSIIGGFLWRGTFDAGTAALTLAAFVGLGIIAVLVDRRALLVSGLAYAGTACSILLRQANLASSAFPATLLLLGAFILLLSAGWRPLRQIFLGLLPAVVARRLPNPGTALSS